MMSALYATEVFFGLCVIVVLWLGAIAVLAAVRRKEKKP